MDSKYLIRYGLHALTNRGGGSMTRPLTAHLVVPVADEADAAATATAIEPYRPDQITVLHVVEKGDGAPDKLSLEQAERRATAAFAAFREHVADVEEQLLYDTDIVAAITDAAADVEASAIAFRPRGGSRLIQFLSGDVALKLITEAERPVIALPEGDSR